VRVRSFTQLEQGRAAAMSRHVYFAAFVPSSGMRFPSDTAVYALHHRPWEVSRGRHTDSMRSESEWQNGQLTLKNRYLGSREQRQFMVLRSVATSARLDVQEIPQPDVAGKPQPPKLRVTNRLGVPIEMALLRDARNRAYLLENLAVDQGTDVFAMPPAPELIKPPKANPLQEKYAFWLEKIQSQAPKFPENFSPDQLSALSRYSQSWGYYGRRGGSSTGQVVSKLEQGWTLAQQVVRNSSTGVVEAKSSVATSRQYFVITSQTLIDSEGEPLVPIGLPQATMAQQSHLIQGSW